MMADPTPARTNACISYSHRDRKYFEELYEHVLFLEHQGIADIFWADAEIEAGAEWRKQIRNAIASAKVAIFLVSPAFLVSNFIARHELPPLLAAARANKALVLSILLEHSLFDYSELSHYQTVNTPSELLGDLKRHKRNKIWVKLVKQVMEALRIKE